MRPWWGIPLLRALHFPIGDQDRAPCFDCARGSANDLQKKRPGPGRSYDAPGRVNWGLAIYLFVVQPAFLFVIGMPDALRQNAARGQKPGPEQAAEKGWHLRRKREKAPSAAKAALILLALRGG